MSHKLCVLVVALCVAAFTTGAANADVRAEDRPDRFKGFNKAMHKFNSGLHRRVLRPVGKAVDFVVPDVVEDGISGIVENLAVPGTMVHNLAQGKPKEAGQDLARFGINTTLGVAGIFDPATRMGIPRHEEDGGQTLGKYGVGSGPYIVLPVLGGTTPRDFAGSLLDPTRLIGGDGLSTVQNAGTVVDVASLSESPDLPGYDEQRIAYHDFRRCSIADGAAEVSDSCQSICLEFEEMVSAELNAISEDPNNPERLEMQARADNFIPAYCKAAS